jgi:hypothetical protein
MEVVRADQFSSRPLTVATCLALEGIREDEQYRQYGMVNSTDGGLATGYFVCGSVT